VRLPDIAGLTFSLGRLADRSAELPLRAELPATFGDRGATAEQVEPGLARLWATLKEAVLGVVRVERRSAPVAQVLSAEERSLARRQLVLELQVARVAVLRAEPQAFEAGLRSAIELLRRDFDASAAEVEGAIGLLTGMLELDVAPERPDISASLNLLRTLPAGAD
jgi:uroporphyrin-3 C-methyltransferase